MSRFLVSLLGCLTVWEACAQSAATFLADEFRIKGAVIGLYNGTEAAPSAVVRLDRVYRDYESKGFFRIGLLPIGVMEGVTVELHHPESVTNGLAQLDQWLGAKATKRLELRRVKFLVSAPVTNRLETGRARAAADGKLALLDEVNFSSGTNQIRAKRGVLQITGGQAGQLVLETAPPWTNNLFGRFETPKPSIHAKLQ